MSTVVNMNGNISTIYVITLVMNEEQVAIIENTVLYKKWPTIVEECFNKNTDSKLFQGFCQAFFKR